MSSHNQVLYWVSFQFRSVIWGDELTVRNHTCTVSIRTSHSELQNLKRLFKGTSWPVSSIANLIYPFYIFIFSVTADRRLSTTGRRLLEWCHETCQLWWADWNLSLGCAKSLKNFINFVFGQLNHESCSTTSKDLGKNLSKSLSKGLNKVVLTVRRLIFELKEPH